MADVDLELRRRMSAAYWEMHAPSDDCPVDMAHMDRARLLKPTRHLSQAKYSAYNASRSREGLRVFREGEIFDARQFPPGTIIGADGEELRLLDIADPTSLEYWEGRKVGVVVNGKNQRPDEQMLALFTSRDQGGSIRSVEEPEIPVGVITHQKVREPKTRADILRRFHTVTIYEIGRGQEQLARGRSFRPFLRALPGLG